MNLYVFNPEHDLCLFNGTATFVPPQRAVRFSEECAWIMAWLYGSGYVLCMDEVDEATLRVAYDRGIRCTPVTPPEVKHLTIDQVVPWGWDEVLLRRLRLMHVSTKLPLPTSEQLELWRRMQHRAFALQGALYIADHVPDRSLLAPPAVLLRSEDEVTKFLQQYSRIVLKTPWSGSGQGVRFFFDNPMSENECGWVRNNLLKQQCLVGNPYYNLTVDFALEFQIATPPSTAQPAVTFVGYSLFRTQGGAYQGNRLLPDAAIRSFLQQFIPLSLLDKVQLLLTEWITYTVAPHYEGPLGVDMFIYQQADGTYALNPMCEINLRYTMGHLAHSILQHNADFAGYDLTVSFGSSRMASDAIQLTPVGDDTLYRCEIG